MAGRHLRRARRAPLRTVLVVVGVLLVGIALGAGGVVVDDAGLLAGSASEDDDEAARGTAQLVPEPGPVTIALGGHVGAEALTARLGDRAADPLGGFGDVLAGSDLAVLGVEGTVSVPDDEAATDDPTGQPVPELDALVAAGIDVVPMANDGSVGTGPDAVYRLLAVAQSRPGTVIGVGADEAEAYAPFVRDVGGHRIAVLAATQVLAADRITDATAGPGSAGVASAKRVDRLVAEVEATVADADVVIVHVHWGVEGETCASPGQRELASALVEAGADVVVGSNPAYPLGVERMGEALVAYGLGGLFTPTDQGGGAVLRVAVDGDGVADDEWLGPAAGDEPPAAC